MTASCELIETPDAPDSINVKETGLAATQSSVCHEDSVEISLPAQPVVSVESLAVAYVIVLNSLAETLFEHIGSNDDNVDSNETARRRREVYAAVWAANRAALEASSLSSDERRLMVKIVWRRLPVHWKDFGTSNEATREWLEKRADEYLSKREDARPVTTASHVVGMLMETTGNAGRCPSMQARVLSSLVGHRIVSDVCHFNELKSRYRFI
jgi:hypothetical protein